MLTDELKRKLIQSVGTHRGQRKLSPMEVAESFEILEKEGLSPQEMADMVLFRDSTMVQRFLRLLRISPALRHLIDWGRSASTISFTVASELARLEPTDQEILLNAALKYQLSKYEITQIVQTKKRSDKEVGICIDEILKLRPRIIQKYLFVGALHDENVSSVISTLTQAERDQLIERAINKNLSVGNIQWSARLGKIRFTLVCDEQLAKQLNRLVPNFEVAINNWLHEVI